MSIIVGFMLILMQGACLTKSAPDDDFANYFVHADAQARIVGAETAQDGSIPYMAAISFGSFIKNFICGASLITEEHVLTAAHCVEALYLQGSLRSSARIRIGTNRWNTGGQIYNVTRNVTHEDFDSRIIKNDIGILITSSKVILSETVQPVPLSFDFVGGGVLSRVGGWGYIINNGPLSYQLLELNVTTLEGQKCIDDLHKHPNAQRLPPVYPELEICTYHSPGHGVCNGDSGSALVNTVNGAQIGIVSWGLPCARGYPDMFTRVSAFESWIKKAIA